MDPENADPVVSFMRGDEEFILGNGDDDNSAILIYGSEGLGVAPVEFATKPKLNGDGDVIRGRRFTSREVYIPFLLEAETAADLSQKRRALNRFLALPGDVTIRIQDPATGSDRYIVGAYSGGLEGNFSEGYHGAWQALGLKFYCADPWWKGPQREETLRINPGSKPFLSKTSPFFPVKIAQSAAIGEFRLNISGDGPVKPHWTILGPGSDLSITDNKLGWIEISGDFAAGSETVFDAETSRLTPRSRWETTSSRTRGFALDPGSQKITIRLANATTETIVRMLYRERYLEGY